MNKSSQFLVGVDLGGTNIVSLLCSEDGEILARRTRKTRAQEGKERTIDRITCSIQEVLDEAVSLGISPNQIEGIGVGSPGPLNTNPGIIHFAPNLPGWINVPLVKILEQRINLPVYLEKDANAAALGEWWLGAGKNVDNLILLTLGTGIGGGIIIQGQVYHGSWDTAAEIGHIIIHEEGLLCGCGTKGCLEAYASAMAVVKKTLVYLKSGAETIIKEWVGDKWEEITCKMVFKAASQGDQLGCRILEETSRYLGIGIASMVNVLNPQMVILAGGVSKAGELLLKPVRKYSSKYALKVAVEGVKIVLGELGDNAGALGAAATVLKRKQLL